MKLLSIINFTAAFQGIFLSILLFNKKKFSPENIALALLIAVIAIFA
jgi:hypothetical protein